MSDCSKECEYDDIDESYLKKRPAGEECSDIKERARENTELVSGEKGIQHSPLCDKKEEERHHVYAVAHKERKERGNSEASTLIKSSCRPQEGTSRVSVESETPQAGGSIEYLYAAVDKTKKKKKQPQVIHFANPKLTDLQTNVTPKKIIAKKARLILSVYRIRSFFFLISFYVVNVIRRH